MRAPIGWGVLICLLVVAAIQTPVHAYIDPGTSGMGLQVIIGALTALMVAMRARITRAWLRWRRG